MWSADQVQDAVQETFLRVLRFLRAGNRPEHPSKFPAFVKGVCHNVVMEMNRGGKREPAASAEEIDVVSPEPKPEDTARYQELEHIIERIVSELPEIDRAILTAAWSEDLDMDSLRERFQVSANYMRVRLFRARKKVRAALEKKLEERPKAKGAW